MTATPASSRRLAARFWLVVDESDLCFAVNRETIDLAMSSISWLHAPRTSPVAPKQQRELTARQRIGAHDAAGRPLAQTNRQQLWHHRGDSGRSPEVDLPAIPSQVSRRTVGVVPAGAQIVCALESGSEDRNLTKHPRIRGWRGSAPRKHIQT